MKKRIVSLLLAIVMIVGMIPMGAISAFAAITPEPDIPVLVSDESGAYHITSADDWTKFGTMVTAGSNTFEDKTVVLDADLTVNKKSVSGQTMTQNASFPAPLTVTVIPSPLSCQQAMTTTHCSALRTVRPLKTSP